MEPTDVRTVADLRAAIPALEETRYLNVGASAACPSFKVVRRSGGRGCGVMVLKGNTNSAKVVVFSAAPGEWKTIFR